MLTYDVPEIAEVERSWAFGIVALAAIAVAVALELRSQIELELPAVVAATTSALLAAAAALELYNNQQEGAALLALAIGYAAIGVALLRRRRDFASVLGLLALGLAIPASIELLNGTMLVLAWAAAAAVLVVLARFEERLEWAALSFFGLALVHTLVMEAQPSDLFVAQRQPGSGVPAVLLVIAAGVELAVPEHPAALGLHLAAVGALGLYAASLAILQLAESLGSASVETIVPARPHGRQLALGPCRPGAPLRRVSSRGSARAASIAGFVLFGLSLVKLFVYDLAFLSSIARAFSFLAVGAADPRRRLLLPAPAAGRATRRARDLIRLGSRACSSTDSPSCTRTSAGPSRRTSCGASRTSRASRSRRATSGSSTAWSPCPTRAACRISTRSTGSTT